MKRNGQGLTATYNRFHAPDEYDGEILKLRALHDAMDRAVLDAYGWSDLKPACEFLLDWEEPEDDEGAKAAQEEEAVALALARRDARRGARAIAGAQRGAREGGGPRGAPRGRNREGAEGWREEGPRKRRDVLGGGVGR